MDLPRVLGLCFCLSVLAVTGAVAGGAFAISSPAFQNGLPIPRKYSLHGGNAAPPLRFADVPAAAKSLAVIADDPDSPTGLWTHWLVWNIPAQTSSLSGEKLPAGAVLGKNSFGNVRYDGPAPPNGTHRYFFRVYALDTMLPLPPGASRGELDAAMAGHVIGHAECFGVFAKK